MNEKSSLNAPRTHDDRKGRHYYTRWLRRPTQACIVVMTLAVIMQQGWSSWRGGGSSCSPLVRLVDPLKLLDGFFHLLASRSFPFGLFNVVYKPLFLGVREPLKQGICCWMLL